MKAMIENERKFRVTRGFFGGLEDGVEITQGYLSVDPPVRVRVENFTDSFLTIKIKKEPGINYEATEEIPEEIGKELMAAHKYRKVRKTRYRIGRFEIDVFLAELEGLVLIEFEQKFSGEPMEIPPGFEVEEVTGDERFENHNLCQLSELPAEWRCQNASRSL